MASEYVTFDDLVRFHRDVIAPHLEAVLDAKLDAKLDERLTPMAQQISRQISRLDDRLDSIHGELQATRREMHEGFDGLHARFDELSTDFDASKGGLRRVEKRVDRHEARILRLEKNVR